MMAWTRSFSEPIPLPDGGQLADLSDAGEYILRLPSAIQQTKAWQTAMHVLIEAADRDGPIEFARLGMMQALRPKAEPVYHSASKDPVWRNTRKLVRDR